VALAFLLVAWLTLAAVVYFRVDWSWYFDTEDPDRYSIFWHWSTLIAPAAGLAVAWLLWRCVNRLRVRRAVARRALCARCGYGLVGLKIDDTGALSCPECRTRRTPYPELAELRDGLYTPRTDLIAPRFWTRRRLAFTGVGLLSVAAVAGAVWLGVVLVRRAQFSADQARARADLPRLEAEFRALFPGPAPGGPPNIHTLIAELDAEFNAIVEEVRAEFAAREAALQAAGDAYDAALLKSQEDPVVNPPPEGEPPLPAPMTAGNLQFFPDDIWREIEPSRRSEVYERSFAAAVLNRWEARGGPDRLFALDAHLDLTPPAGLASSVNPFVAGVSFKRIRWMYRWTNAVCQAAMEREEPERWLRAARCALQLGAAARSAQSTLGLLVSTAVEYGPLRGAAERVAIIRAQDHSSPNADAWLAAVQALVQDAELANGSSPAGVAADRISNQGALALAFDDGSQKRLDALIDEGPLGGPPPGRFGRYEENRQAIIAANEAFGAMLRTLPAPSAIAKDENADLAIASSLAQTSARVLEGQVSLVQSTIALATLIALERHRLAHGSYPDTLEKLAVPIVGGPPRDLYNPSGGTLIYRPVTIPGHRPMFILYSVGPNGADNSGACAGHMDAFRPLRDDTGDMVFFHVSESGRHQPDPPATKAAQRAKATQSDQPDAAPPTTQPQVSEPSPGPSPAALPETPPASPPAAPPGR
jgi:hypothetical protein